MTSYFKIMSKNDSIDIVETKGTTASLLASYKGTEVIRHTLKKGTSWVLYPQDGWDELECLVVISGEFMCEINEDKKVVLHSGDTFSAFPVKNHFLFLALNDVEFMYIVSKPIFHNYNSQTQKFWDLAIEIEQKDGSTSDHCERIRTISMEIGRCLGLSTEQLKTLVFGSFLHDLGKLRIPDSILKKPGKLTPDEFEIMKMHTIFGKDILLEAGLPYLISASIILEQHHERYNGTGYPYGLKEEGIDILSAIVAVADSYDAMRSKRVYKDAKPRELAIEEIARNRGILYHPIVVDSFLKIVSKID